MSKTLPSSPCKWYQESTWLLYEKLGISGRKIPKTKHGHWRIDGWDVIVRRGTNGQIGKPRIFVRHNGRFVPVGRVRQALCRRFVHRARKRAEAHRGSKGRFVYRRRSG